MIIIIIGSLIILGFLIFSLIKKPMITISVLVLIVIGVFVYRFIFGFFPIPIGIRHLAHWIAPPKDLFQPILEDKFLFYEKGFTKTYHLKPKYFGGYYIGFFVGGEGITSKYKFKGKLDVEFFWKDKFLFKDGATGWVSAAYSKNAMTYFSEVDLYRFDIPLEGKYVKEVRVKITVLEPDEELEQFGDLITLFIKIAPSK
ncbi:hypothetical protein KKG41_06685 [Patescibacteria group bacterium]|nr:hypothetical protein [Patescibacteria group bacterium]MBU1891127.1 hypothetical protein [Patescibacteria group bacterium]